MFHMVAVGLSSSILGCLLTLLVYTYCQRYQQQAHDATVIHPVAPAPLNTSITNHINKLDKYDSVEAIKVRHAQRPPQPAREEGGWPRGRPAKRGAGRGAGGRDKVTPPPRHGISERECRLNMGRGNDSK